MGHAQDHLSSTKNEFLSLPSPPILHQYITTLKGHSSYVSAIAVDHHSSMYSASFDQTIRSWPCLTTPNNSTETFRLIASTKSPVKCLMFSSDYLFSAHQDHKIRVWRIENKDDQCNSKMKASLPTTLDRMQSLLVPKNYVQIRRHKKCTWVHHVDAVSDLAVSTDGSVLYSVSWDRSIKVWRVSDFKCMQSITRAHHDAINAVVVSKDGYIYTASADTNINIWKACHQNVGKHSLVLVDSLHGHKSGVNALALSSDGFVLYSGASDHCILVWERCDGALKSSGVVLRGHGMAVLCLAVVGDHEYELLCSGSGDRTVRVWRRGGDGFYGCLCVLGGHDGAVKSLAMAVECESSGDCNSVLVFSGGLDCNIRVWRLFL